jgi:hypothetical protein
MYNQLAENVTFNRDFTILAILARCDFYKEGCPTVNLLYYTSRFIVFFCVRATSPLETTKRGDNPTGIKKF